MHGKVIQFKADTAIFQVKECVVNIQLTADARDIALDQLSEISSGPVMVNLEASQTELLPDNEESKNTDANNK
ncbi:hypothetical protein [Lactobacillus helveticus]|uniref:hypothetical protein n=1 Tax=Lactobacillus helveticus TaxID=1587 RepID=UPI00156729C6|nr:hypothetical protein [Lactobacillus helveticus]NRO57397.1 hypothetical protein [Lactobacillus helveticus]